MQDYQLVSKIIGNKTVLKVLNSGKFEGTEDFFAKVLEDRDKETVFEIYPIYFVDKEANSCAKVIRKKDSFGINNWYVQFNRKFSDGSKFSF